MGLGAVHTVGGQGRTSNGLPRPHHRLLLITVSASVILSSPITLALAHGMRTRRASSCVYCVCVFLTGLFLVAGNKPVEIAKLASSWTAVAATSMLFVIRVRAVYNDNKIIRALFSVLWFLVVTSQTAILYGYHSCEFTIPLRVPWRCLKMRSRRPNQQRGFL